MFIYQGDECEKGKPHPEPYLEGMKRVSATPDECVVFEDSPSGIKAAVAAGVKLIVGITTSHSEEALKSFGAHVASKKCKYWTH